MSAAENLDLLPDFDTKFDIFKIRGEGAGDLKIPGKTSFYKAKEVKLRFGRLIFDSSFYLLRILFW